MSTFDIRPDAPGLLRSEAANITIKFDRTGPTTGRISWNIPTPALGCTADTQAFCGIVVTIDTSPASATKLPQQGQVYSSDATADTNLFAGDKLGTSLIVGAFYQDRTTTFFDVTGLKANTPYYVTGFPVDCQLRYYVEGVHSYSLDYKNRGTDGTCGSQVVVMNSDAGVMGVDPDLYTGLDAGTDYTFTIKLGLDPKPDRPLSAVDVVLQTPSFPITIQGDTAQTFADLVVSINKQLALLSNAAQGPTPPNAGSFYYNRSQSILYQWDGFVHNELPVLIENTAPDNISTGTFWNNTSTNTLNLWTGTTWSITTVLPVAHDPTIAKSDITFWFSGSNVYEWNGVTWCEVTVSIGATDPSLAQTPNDGTFWYDEANSILYRWNGSSEMWIRTDAVQSTEDPKNLPNTTYWFNNLNNTLSLYDTPNAGWNTQSNVSIAEVAPSTPAAGKLWYKPTAMQLFQRDSANAVWVEQDVIVYHQDPTDVASCGVWWNLTNEKIYVWNTLTSAWVQSPAFLIQSNDPAADPVLGDGTTWFDTTTNQLYEYQNNCFKPAVFVQYATNPMLGIADGIVWYDTTNKIWYNRISAAWVAFDPIDSPTDPRSLPSGTFWYNPSATALSRWNGAAWVSITFVTSPLTPSKGTLWFDTVASSLKQWNGSSWELATPKATVEFDANSNLMFTDTNVGSNSYVSITDGTLFQSLEIGTQIYFGKAGTDGASDTPMYSELGIGTDGSNAARDAIITDLRYELGYPVLDVELTKEQMDYAVDRALSELRGHSGIAYRRGFFIMSIPANEQRLMLTSKRQRHDRIVDVLGVYRLTSSFIASAHGAGAYGQIILQNLYNMGSFDMLSYHLMSEYTKLMEILFAARVTYTWNEQTREIFLHHRFAMSETMVAVEATEERTEQDIMTDRYTKAWIRRYAGAMCRLMLAEIRGKFSSLPGAGGSVTLNASELRSAAQQTIEECMQEIADYVADRPEEYGMGTQFLFG